MDHGANDVRSCIIASKNLPITSVNNYTSGDCAVGMLETNLSACPKICLISLYLDINLEIMSPNLKRLLRKLQLERIPYLILTDSNSHSSLWGSETTNTRGRKVENDLIGPNNLGVVNEGNEPTFYSRRWGSYTHTDLILTSPEIDDLLSGFVVRDACIPSDHASLEVRLHLGINPTSETKFDMDSMETSDWNSYKEEMDN